MTRNDGLSSWERRRPGGSGLGSNHFLGYRKGLAGEPAGSISIALRYPTSIRLAGAILNCSSANKALAVADTEHYVAELLEYVKTKTPFDLLVLMPKGRAQQAELQALHPSAFITRWAGFATTKRRSVIRPPA